jgi:hypothetical protein
VNWWCGTIRPGVMSMRKIIRRVRHPPEHFSFNSTTMSRLTLQNSTNRRNDKVMNPNKMTNSYNALYPRGTKVRIVPLEDLEAFRAQWTSHNKLTPEQLKYAGRVATVEDLGYYFGGDTIYKLADIPGTWHEQCLRPA